jgi:hypothetical protein
MTFLKKFLILLYRGFSGRFLRFLAFSSKSLYGYSQFFYDCSGQRGTSFELDGFLRKCLTLAYGGLSVHSFKVFCPLYKTAPRNFPIFCLILEDSMAHCLSQMAFLKKILITDDRGLSDRF